MWIVLAACVDEEGGTTVRAGAPDGGDSGSPDSGGDSGDGGGGDDSGDTGSGEDSAGSECEAFGQRARCSVWGEDLESTGTLDPGLAFDAVIPSWNAVTPAGASIEVELAVRVDGEWSGWYSLGVWAGGESTVDRHSIDGQSDSLGALYTDTLFLNGKADAAKLRVSRQGGATVSRLAIAVANSANENADAGGEAWGVELDMPDRSQMEFDEGEAWCSPTTMSMILGYHADRLGDATIDASVPVAADQTWDSVYEGNGNWPFNTAFAATRGLVAEVGWFGAVSEMEPWIAAGYPVAVSAAWSAGELDNAPISSTDGHILVVRGFSANGDVHVNDPAASSDSDVPRTYDRDQFRDVWMGGSGGVVYLVWDGARP